MTHDPIEPEDHDIPELFDRLESRVASPDPEAIRAEAGRRGAARRRSLVGAGVFVLVATLLCGLWVSNRNAVNETVTAAEFDRTVAEDSAPLEFDWATPTRLRELMKSEVWSVGGVSGSPPGFIAQSGRVWFGDNRYSLLDGPALETVNYSTGCDGSTYAIEWNDSGFTVLGELIPLEIQATANCFDPPYPLLTFEAGETISINVGSEPASMTMAKPGVCRPDTICRVGPAWTVELTSSGLVLPGTVNKPNPTEPLPAVVSIAECSNGSRILLNSDTWLPIDSNGMFLGTLPTAWEDAGTVDVTVVIDENTLIATDDADLTAPFGKLMDDAIVPFPCFPFTYEPPIDDTPAPVSTDLPDAIKFRGFQQFTLASPSLEGAAITLTFRTERFFIEDEWKTVDSLRLQGDCRDALFNIAWLPSGGFEVIGDGIVTGATGSTSCNALNDVFLFRVGQVFTIELGSITHAVEYRLSPSDDVSPTMRLIAQVSPTAPTPDVPTDKKPDLPTVDARSDADCIDGFLESAAASDAIVAPQAVEDAYAIFQAGDEWEGRTDVCWISISTDTSCRSYAWFRELGDPPATFREDPPLNPNKPCPSGGHGTEFN